MRRQGWTGGSQVRRSLTCHTEMVLYLVVNMEPLEGTSGHTRTHTHMLIISPPHTCTLTFKLIHILTLTHILRDL